jgi:hypothetical protein
MHPYISEGIARDRRAELVAAAERHRRRTPSRAHRRRDSVRPPTTSTRPTFATKEPDRASHL